MCVPLEIQFRMKTTRQINNGIAGGTQADHLKFQGESGGLQFRAEFFNILNHPSELYRRPVLIRTKK